MIEASNRGVGRWEWSPNRVGPVVMFLSDGVNVQVLEPFTYHDPDGRAWPVPAGAISDGASIPRGLWTSVGAPLTGRYRNAALVHDVIYRNQLAPKDVADQVLLDAMRGSGVDEVLAIAIFQGVHFGGAWSYAADARLHAKET